MIGMKGNTKACNKHLAFLRWVEFVIRAFVVSLSANSFGQLRDAGPFVSAFNKLDSKSQLVF
jgi:hypothetical protein